MKTFFLLIAIIVSTSISAQDLVWHTDMNKAIEIAQKENKKIMLFFTGSDWCGWCIRLQNEVLKKPEFAAWATKNVVLVDVDFPKKNNQTDAIKAQNSGLQQMFEVRGYPTVWFVNISKNAEGKVNLEKLGSTGYVAGGPVNWITGADQILLNGAPK
jgi:thioredoxin-related protein